MWGEKISIGTNSNGPVQLARDQGRGVLVAGRAECAFSNSRGFHVTVLQAAPRGADAIKNRFPSDVLFCIVVAN